MAVTFSVIGCKPFESIVCPKYWTDSVINEHFVLFNLRPAVSNLGQYCVKRCQMFLLCFSCDQYVIQVDNNSLDSLKEIMCWNTAGANDIPKGSLLYSKSPRWVLITVYFLNVLSNFIGWYAWLMSNFENFFPPPRIANRSWIFCIGYCSSFVTGFGHLIIPT